MMQKRIAPNLTPDSAKSDKHDAILKLPHSKAELYLTQKHRRCMQNCPAASQAKLLLKVS
jgi:hypothetical protein